MTSAAAYAACLRLARSHYENFPVASWLMPRAARPHIAAVYAFARMADDVADEGSSPEPVRLAELERWQRRLDAAAEGRVEEAGDETIDATSVALAETLRTFGASRMHALLSDLLSAFRQDVVLHRYASWPQLLDYCRRSANPVGRLVLTICGYDDEPLRVKSDAVCTALQLTNFWQDLEIDWSRGRLYVPQDIVDAHHAHTGDLGRRMWSPQWRDALEDAGLRTRKLYEAGRGVADHVTGRLRWELRATVLGGLRILDRLAEADYDVFRARPTLSKRDAPALIGGALLWRARP